MEQLVATEQPREYQLAAAVLAKKDKRQASSYSKGAASAPVAYSAQLLPRLTAHLLERLKTPCRVNSPEYNLERQIRQLDLETVALVCLQAGFTVAANSHNARGITKAFNDFAYHLEAELFRAGLFKANRKIAKRVETYAAKNHANRTMRHSAARATAQKLCGFATEDWTAEEKTIAGAWCANLLTEGLPDVFLWDTFTAWNKQGGYPEKHRILRLTEEAAQQQRDILRGLIERNPVWLPRRTPPNPWTGFRGAPSDDARVKSRSVLVKTFDKAQTAAIKRGIADGTMAPALKGINALQAVPFRINSWLLAVMNGVLDVGIDIPGFTIGAPVPVPPKLSAEEWEALGDEGRKLANDERKATLAINRQRHGDLTTLALDMEEAHRLNQHPEFYLPMYLDFRGRVYAFPRFNFQRGDHVRALFLFKNGAPITKEGTYWLAVHVANCWAQKGPDGIGLDKKPLNERASWTSANYDTLKSYVTNPLHNLGWTKADSPFMFLAAAMEWVSAIDMGPDYVCRLPISFDGSCSGLQHLSAAMRASEGALVNLTDTAAPSDIYSIVAAEALKIIKADAQGTDENKRRYAGLFLSYNDPTGEGRGVDRKLLKRNCMTFCYSSEAPGMGDQQYEDLMVPLQATAIRTGTPHHFGTRKEQADAARYMGRVAYAAITGVVRKPAEAMDFLKGVAGAMAHEGKPVEWVSPAGLPCVNSYREWQTKKINLWLHNEQVQVHVANAQAAELLKKKCKQAIAPNFVHSMDAAHLLLTAGAAVDEGITDIATVHDSFGCLPAHAARFNQIIREQFVLMYQQHDTLTRLHHTARASLSDANQWRLPPLPDKGPLDLNEVLRAKYAFA